MQGKPPRLLIEEWLPAAAIGVECIRERSTCQQPPDKRLHVWWARRPLAACRAVICAALWPDPADEQCPPAFREAASRVLSEFADKARTDRTVIVPGSPARPVAVRRRLWPPGVGGGPPSSLLLPAASCPRFEWRRTVEPAHR